MSFPELLVRVARHTSLSLSYVDEAGAPHELREVDRPLAELLQHEIDHLDGVLAVDRALDREAIVMQRVYTANRAFYDAQVDYTIPGVTRVWRSLPVAVQKLRLGPQQSCARERT
jgi:peptide deformylase